MKPKLLIIAVGVAIGYVLGTRDGRARYDLMKAKVTELWEDPRVVRARKDVESYARAQAPVIRERAEAAAKAAPGVAKDVAGKVASVATDVAGQVSDTAKDVATKATATAKDVSARATGAAKDARTQATKVASDLRERGEGAVDSAVESAGKWREAALETVSDSDADDEDDPKPAS